MKKLPVLFATIGCLCLLVSASVWEGAAAVTSNGELPEKGFYAASSSFPRNTVVEVTNLETRKTVRVVVAAGLDSPGLLALLSRDAADAIGLQHRSVGRIRMTMPSDPIAFSRFTEGLNSSGDPDHDPRAAVAANYPTVLGPVDSGETAPVSDTTAVPPVISSEDISVEEHYLSNAEPAEEEPEAGETIVDVPYSFEPTEALTEDEGISAEPSPELAWVYPEEIVDGADLTEPEPEVAVHEEDDEIPETFMYPDPFLAYTEPEANDEPIAGTEESDYPETAEALAEGETPDTVWDMADAEITLVPAEERPPESSWMELPGDAEISPLPDAALSAGEPETVIPEEHIIGSPEAAVSGGTPAIHPDYSERTSGGAAFSVPVIDRLEQGKYYLQLGAFSYADSVENELSKIGRAYPLAVQIGGTGTKPLYRILVGPVNLGESGALLQRFKTIGYGDAFIRQES
ncbi:SPOR domain-containing protein [Breznakiella homolactica]|uniref:SPOR domain-containing protein n=1 Tax=Breznakiella homolactica TaxID=2798577 RepID=A0A7T8B939_9SPIR|nr:SPOR domain-containing protein [Breznakiella homolactica]QQO08057.1 SPOR domain-containing protein [Breznakiella homolactica]